jgi:hypothetical protein
MRYQHYTHVTLVKTVGLGVYISSYNTIKSWKKACILFALRFLECNCQRVGCTPPHEVRRNSYPSPTDDTSHVTESCSKGLSFS